MRKPNLSLVLCHALIHLLAFGSAAFPLGACAAEAPRPISPGETAAGPGFNPLWQDLLLSPDGRWLAFANTRGGGYMDLTTGKMFNAKEGWGMGRQIAAWSPDGKTLALLVSHEGKSALAVSRAPFESARELLILPRDLYTWTPLANWSPDSKTLFVILRQQLPAPKLDPKDDHPPAGSINVRLQMSGTYRIRRDERERYEKEYPEAYAEKWRALILAIDVASGRTGILARGNDIDGVYVSPDGKRLAAVQLKRESLQRAPANEEVSPLFAKQSWADVYLIDVPEVAALPTVDLEKLEDRKAGWFDGSRRRLDPVLTDLPFMSGGLAFFGGTNGNPTISWAPDSTAFAYATVGKQATGDLFLFELAARRARSLTAEVALAPSSKSLGYAEDWKHHYNSPKFGSRFTPLWLPGGEALVAVGKGEAWYIPRNPDRGAPHELTAAVPQETIRVLPAVRREQAAVDADGRLTLIAKDRESRYDSIWKLDPASGAASKVADTGVWIDDRSLVSDQRCAALFYIGQSIQSAANLYRLRLDGGESANLMPERITDYRLYLSERIFPESRVLSWQTPGGDRGHGLLYLPPGATAQAKVPLLVYSYPDDPNSQVDKRAAEGASFYNDFLDDLLRDGIAVLYPDIPLSDWGMYEQPMKQLVEGVDAATDAALATGVIDEKRIGIMGGSYGGYMVNAVVAHTDRFKAAASVAGLSDLFGNYLGAVGDAVNFYERGQGRMGKPLWEDPQRYVENSPLIHWDKVRTPLLIVHGELDRTVPLQFGMEGFKGLNRLDRPAIFAVYSRMGHSANPEALQRIRGWFREHLLGAAPITHLADQGSFFLGSDEAGDLLSAPSSPTEAPSR